MFTEKMFPLPSNNVDVVLALCEVVIVVVIIVVAVIRHRRSLNPFPRLRLGRLRGSTHL